MAIVTYKLIYGKVSTYFYIDIATSDSEKIIKEKICNVTGIAVNEFSLGETEIENDKVIPLIRVVVKR